MGVVKLIVPPPANVKAELLKFIPIPLKVNASVSVDPAATVQVCVPFKYSLLDPLNVMLALVLFTNKPRMVTLVFALMVNVVPAKSAPMLPKVHCLSFGMAPGAVTPGPPKCRSVRILSSGRTV